MSADLALSCEMDLLRTLPALSSVSPWNFPQQEECFLLIWAISTHQRRRSWWWNWGSVTGTCLHKTDELFVTEPNRNPTGEANFFAHSFQAPSSQLSDQKNPHRRFWCGPSAKASCIWWGFYCLPFEFFPSLCSSPFRDTKPSPSFLPLASHHPSFCIHFHLGGDASWHVGISFNNWKQKATRTCTFRKI